MLIFSTLIYIFRLKKLEIAQLFVGEKSIFWLVKLLLGLNPQFTKHSINGIIMLITSS